MSKISQAFTFITYRQGIKRLLTRIRTYPKISFGIVLILSLIAVFLLPENKKALQVLETAAVERGDLKKELPVVGIMRLEAGAEVKTGSQFTGVIRKLYVELGDRVEKGQIIAELDDREQKAECEKLEAALRRLKAELRKVEETYPLLIAEADSQIIISKEQAKYADSNLKLQSKLRGGVSVSEDNLNKARERAQVTKEEVLLSIAARQRLEMELNRETERLREAMAEAEAELLSAQTRLSYARIVSPMAGVVSEITAQEGETIVTGLQVAYLITVIDPARLELQMYVDENDIGMVKPGVRVAFSVEAFPEKTFEGIVELIHPGPEIRNNIVYYRALVRLEPEVALQLRPEMTARCRVAVAEQKDTLLVPSTALKWLGTKRVIFVQDDNGTVRTVNPTSGLTGLTHTEILSGLEEQQRVVTRLELPTPLPKEWTE